MVLTSEQALVILSYAFCSHGTLWS